MADSGALFRCVVSNGSVSTTSNAARLTVIGPTSPQFTHNPVDQLIGVGQSATFTVGAIGAGTLTYQWQKNSADISGAKSASYTTPAAALVDSGTLYRCVVSNGSGTATSTNGILKVTIGSVSILSNSGFERGTESWAFYTNGSGAYTVVPAGPWNPDAARINIIQEGGNVQLYQSPVTLETGAEYLLFFRGLNSSGHDVSVSVQKHAAPFGSYGLLGQVFNLDTAWKDFSTQFTASGFTGVATDTRVMFYLAPYDSANDNFYIDDVVLAKVSSVAPPAIASHPVNKGVGVGKTAVFDVVASGTPPFSYQWQKNGVDIKGGTGPSYTTPAAVVGDNGALFKCIVKNPVGNATSNAATLNVSTTGLADNRMTPASFALDQNYPNPFNPSTTIGYALPAASYVRLTVLSPLGDEVTQLVNSYQEAGYHQVRFDAGNLATGIYFYRITASGFSQTKKLLLVR